MASWLTISSVSPIRDAWATWKRREASPSYGAGRGREASHPLRHVRRAVPRAARRLDRQRRAAEHPRGSRPLGRRPAVGPRRLRDRARQPHARRRHDRRPARPSPRRPGRPDAVRRGLARRGRGPDERGARRRARRAGRRRGAAAAGHARDHHARLPGGGRARAAIGIWAAVAGVSLPAAPVAGGLLVAGPGWRWVSLVNLPIVAAAGVLTARLVRESADPRGRRLDVPGVVLGALTLAATTFALIEAGHESATSPVVLVSAAVALAA